MDAAEQGQRCDNGYRLHSCCCCEDCQVTGTPLCALTCRTTTKLWTRVIIHALLISQSQGGTEVASHLSLIIPTDSEMFVQVSKKKLYANNLPEAETVNVPITQFSPGSQFSRSFQPIHNLNVASTTMAFFHTSEHMNFSFTRNRNHFINLQAPCVLYIRTGVSLLSRERFLYI